MPRPRGEAKYPAGQTRLSTGKGHLAAEVVEFVGPLLRNIQLYLDGFLNLAHIFHRKNTGTFKEP